MGFGQTTCLPVGRRCGECKLSEKGLCPSAVVDKKVMKRVKKEVKNEDHGKIQAEKKEVEVVVKEEEILAADIG